MKLRIVREGHDDQYIVSMADVILVSQLHDLIIKEIHIAEKFTLLVDGVLCKDHDQSLQLSENLIIKLIPLTPVTLSDETQQHKLLEFSKTATKKINSDTQSKSKKFVMSLYKRAQTSHYLVEHKPTVKSGSHHAEQSKVIKNSLKSQTKKNTPNSSNREIGLRIMSEQKDRVERKIDHSIHTMDLEGQGKSYPQNKLAEAHNFIKKMQVQRLQQEKKMQREFDIHGEPGQEGEQNDRRLKFIKKQLEDKQIREIQTQLNIDGNKLIKQIQQDIIHQEQMRRSKEDEMNIPELERRKVALARKRELSVPIRLDELNQHKKKYDNDIIQKQYEREKIKHDAFVEHQSKVIKFPKSSAQIRVQQEDLFDKEKQLRNLEAKKQQRQRQLTYVQVIRDMFPILQLKKVPVESSDNNITQKNGGNFFFGEKNIKKIERVLKHNSNLTQMSHPVKKLDTDMTQTVDIQRTESLENIVKRQNIIIKKLKIQQMAPELPPKVPQTDYLKLMRQQREENQTISPDDQWQKIFEDQSMPQNEKIQYVLKSVQKLEQRARARQSSALQNQDIDAEQEANTLYIESIKAKLSLLDKQR